MRRDWRRFIMAAVLGITVLMAAGCGKTNTEGGGQTEGTKESTETEAAVSEAEEESKALESSPAIIEDFQIVPGYGIVGKNNPQVFVMSSEDMPSVTRDKLVVELEDVLYQDGLWIVKTRVQDFSAEIIPDEEAARIAEEEKERMNRDGGVERDGYFCYNDAMKKYARSLYNDEYGQNIFGRTVLMGTGLPEGGVIFRSYGSSYNYEQLELDGSLTYLTDARAEDMRLEQQPDKGTYELKISGFDDTLKFRLKPAETCENLTDLEGGYEVDGLSVVVQKEPAGNLLGVTWMTSEADPYQLVPQTFDQEKKIVLKGDKGVYQMAENLWLSRGMSYDLQGLSQRGQERTLWFEVPEAEQNGTFTLVIPGIIANERTAAEPVSIPVPEGEEAELSETVEFNGCTLKLTHVKKMPEPMETGMVMETVSGDEKSDMKVEKPALYLTASLESRESEKEAATVGGYREDPSARDYERSYLLNDSGDGEPKPYGHLKGFYVFYDEGESQIPVRFAYPVYYWHKEIEIPVG